MKAVFDHSHQEADNIISIYFKPENPYAYTAGQYAEWTLPHASHDERGQRRWFTISSSPHEEQISLTTKFGQPVSSFKRRLNAPEPGDEIQVSQSMGDFVLPKLIQTPLIFVAGGIGVTPYRSILKWLAETGEQRPVKMIYGVENEDEIIFQEVFDKSKQHVTVVVKNPSPAWGGERGELTAELILGVEKPDSTTLIYVSGPEVMADKLTKQLETTGLDRNQIITDAFLGYKDI